MNQQIVAPVIKLMTGRRHAPSGHRQHATRALVWVTGLYTLEVHLITTTQFVVCGIYGAPSPLRSAGALHMVAVSRCNQRLDLSFNALSPTSPLCYFPAHGCNPISWR